jgi:hypothetical protein
MKFRVTMVAFKAVGGRGRMPVGPLEPKINKMS